MGHDANQARASGSADRRGRSLAPGSLFYCFECKDLVLIEVLRAEVAHRLDVLGAELAAATTFDRFVDASERALGVFLDAEHGGDVVLGEMVGEALRQPELAAAQAALGQDWRREFAAMLEDLERCGVIVVHGRPSALAELITAAPPGSPLSTTRPLARIAAQRSRFRASCCARPSHPTA